MKKFVLFLILAAYIFGCNNNTRSLKPTTDDTSVESGIAKSTINTAQTDDLISDLNDTLPFNVIYKHGEPIKNKELVKMIYRFKKKHNVFARSRSVWYSVGDLKNLLMMIEKSAPSGTEGDGFRVYFGRYHEDLANENYKRRPSVIFVPTHSVKNVDGSPCYDENGKPCHEDAGIDSLEIIQAIREVREGDPLDDKFKTNFFQGYNHGELCPRNCGKISRIVNRY